MTFKTLLSGPKNALVTTFIRSAFIHTASANVFFNLCRWKSNSRLNIKALPLVWMDESTAQEKGLLRRGSEGIAYGPHYIGCVQSTERIYLPNIHYYVFERARVSAASSSVILDEKQVIMDRAIGPDQTKYDFSGGHILAHGCDKSVVRLRKSEDIKKGIFLGGNGSGNYYHWIVEILAKIEFLSKLPMYYQKYPLLVSEEVVRIQSFRDTLDIFAKGHEIIVLSKELQYVVDELIYINAPNNLPFNLFGNQQFKCNYVAIDRLSIDYLRKIGLQDALKKPAISSYPKKIFLHRKSGLRSYNQDEIFNYLSVFGFTKVFMEDLSFLEQVRTVHHADIIIGPTGAAWTNLIFCRSGAKGLCWMANEFGDFSAYSSIAGMVGVDLRYLTYKAGVYSTKDLYSKGYYIDLSMIAKGLSALDETCVSAQWS
jgi:capsular polysaccharide biosynthesis protein